MKRTWSVCGLALAMAMAGCGSSGPASEADAVSSLHEAISTYDHASAHDVPSTGDACRKALQGVQNARILAHPPAAKADMPERQALRWAYTEARAGFADCFRGAVRMDYPTMARADLEIGRANGWLTRARRLER